MKTTVKINCDDMLFRENDKVKYIKIEEIEINKNDFVSVNVMGSIKKSLGKVFFIKIELKSAEIVFPYRKSKLECNGIKDNIKLAFEDPEQDFITIMFSDESIKIK